MFVVDTDTVTLLQYGHEHVADRFRRAAREVATTVISRLEILLGRAASVLKAANGEELLLAQQRLEQTEQYLNGVPILPVTVRAAEQFDKLRENRKLRKIGSADLLIASIVLSHQATLVTRNLKDFRQIPGLQVENWAD